MLKEDAKSQDESQSTRIAQESTFWNPLRVRMLIAAIIIMAFLLLLGFGLVVYKLIEKALVKQENQTKVTQNVEQVPTFEIDLQGYQIKHLAQSGNTLTLHVMKEQSQELWLIDSYSKKIKKIIKLKQ